jgi:hypothetical protein
MNNSTTVDTGYTTAGRLGAACTYLILSAAGLIIYSVVIVTIFKNRKTKFDNSYYTMVYYTAAADCGMMLDFLLLMAPCAFANDYIIGETAMNLLSNFDTLFFHVMMVTLLPVSLNRLFGVGVTISTRMSKMWIAKVFTEKKYVHVLMIMCYVWALGISFAMPYVVKCQKVLFLDQLTFNYLCEDYGSTLFTIYGDYCYIYPIISFIPYVILFLLLRWQRQQSSSVSSDRKKIETRLMIQSTLILVFFIVFGDLCFFLLFGQGNLATVLLGVTEILNAFTSPIMCAGVAITGRRPMVQVGHPLKSARMCRPCTHGHVLSDRHPHPVYNIQQHTAHKNIPSNRRPVVQDNCCGDDQEESDHTKMMIV